MQNGNHAGMYSLGKLLQCMGTEDDRAKWPGLAMDMDKLMSVDHVPMTDIYVMKWLESERGWGQRPDGFSVNLSRNDYEKKLSEYIAEQPSRDSDNRAPDEYSRPAWSSLLVLRVPANSLLTAAAAPLGCWRIYNMDPADNELKTALNNHVSSNMKP